MALEIQNLQEKLNGKLPVDRVELLYLINSWGRTNSFYINENIKILECEAKECCDLSKLDTSEITDMSQLFEESLFNGDISNWDVSKVTNMYRMFEYAIKFNQALNDWDVSNVKDMNEMFYRAKEFNQVLNDWDVSNVRTMEDMFYGAKEFNQALNNWNVSNVTNMDWMFYKAIAFEMKFNNGNPLPKETNELKVWFNNNRDKMLAIDIKEREKDNLDTFFNNLNNINNDIDSTQSEQAELVRKRV